MRADLIAALYKLRWKIELLFKQLKQNFPLKYFLGDNENAIRIQIYCALIANLIMTVIHKKLENKRKWSFSNLVSFTKIHLFNYINLIGFLENPEKDWQKIIPDRNQLTLFGGAYFWKWRKMKNINIDNQILMKSNEIFWVLIGQQWFINVFHS